MVHVIENTRHNLQLSAWVLTGFKVKHPDSKRTPRAKAESKARKCRRINRLRPCLNG